ncbi:MAG: 2-isopropylmalate synthase [Magnetococcales bacterium]|nr:2-isopropylmalate synthase [Magnetococcales bacterium]
MSTMPHHHYRPFKPVLLPDRLWPSKVIDQAPIWCAVDLRDGNQALINPMDPARKLRLFKQLVQIGFKEIEVGFPAASKDDFDFTREIITENHIPDNVTIQLLTQAREHLIRRSFEAIAGARQAIVHLYNSTSPLQRQVVFGMDRRQIIELAVKGVQLIHQLAQETDTTIRLQYSPESFSATELDFSVEICHAVMEAWGASRARPVILNLPATVESATPNVHADQIEWFCRHLPNREAAVISVHPHNDRGTAVAAAELAVMAGAQRVEGTLFGNGERTGNVDLITLAMNLFSQGVDPKVDLSDIQAVVDTYESCSGLAVHPRHPYGGELVFTAFSGSHQDAIQKGLRALKASDATHWSVPYLPVNPDHLGRNYEAFIRINSQSGKGGVSFVLENGFGIRPPAGVIVAFSQIVQKMADGLGRELQPEEIYQAFEDNYLPPPNGYQLLSYDHQPTTEADESCRLSGKLQHEENVSTFSARGSGPVSALVGALEEIVGVPIKINSFEQHGIGEGRDAKAVAYVSLSLDGGEAVFGVGLHANTTTSALDAVLRALSQGMKRRGGAF